MLITSLTARELEYCYDLASRRQTENLAMGRRDAYGFSGGNGLALHQHGVMCEFSASKALRIPFRETRLGEPDLDPDIQVRGRTRHHYDLIVHHPKEDDPNQRFVLVTHDARHPNFCLRGWLYGRECQYRRFWLDPTGTRPAFFVPQWRLRPIETLEAIPVIETG